MGSFCTFNCNKYMLTEYHCFEAMSNFNLIPNCFSCHLELMKLLVECWPFEALSYLHVTGFNVVAAGDKQIHQQALDSLQWKWWLDLTVSANNLIWKLSWFRHSEGHVLSYHYLAFIWVENRVLRILNKFLQKLTSFSIVRSRNTL